LEAANLAVVLASSQASSQQQPAEPAARRGSEAKPAPQPAHKVIAGPTVGGVQLVRAYSGNYVRGDAEKVGLLPLDACWEAEQTAAHAVAFDQFAKGAAKMYCPVATTDELVRAIGGCRARLDAGGNNLYEIMDSPASGGRSRFYADIDVDHKDGRTRSREEHDALLAAAVGKLQEMVQRHLVDFELDPKRLHVSSACREDKTSFHAVYHAVWPRRVRGLWKACALAKTRAGDACGIDHSPYGSRSLMRALYQKKRKPDPRAGVALTPYVSADGQIGSGSQRVEDYLITAFAEAEPELQYRQGSLPEPVARQAASEAARTHAAVSTSEGRAAAAADAAPGDTGRAEPGRQASPLNISGSGSRCRP
jgi:hypothetical protein